MTTQRESVPEPLSQLDEQKFSEFRDSDLSMDAEKFQKVPGVEHLKKLGITVYRLDKEAMDRGSLWGTVSAALSEEYKAAWGAGKKLGLGEKHEAYANEWRENQNICTNPECPRSPYHPMHSHMSPFDAILPLMYSPDVHKCENEKCGKETTHFWCPSRTEEYLRDALSHDGGSLLLGFSEGELYGWIIGYPAKYSEKFGQCFSPTTIIDDSKPVDLNSLVYEQGTAVPIGVDSNSKFFYVDTVGTTAFARRENRKHRVGDIRKFLHYFITRSYFSQEKRKRGDIPVVTRMLQGHPIERIARKKSLGFGLFPIRDIHGHQINGAPGRRFSAGKGLPQLEFIPDRTKPLVNHEGSLIDRPDIPPGPQPGTQEYNTAACVGNSEAEPRTQAREIVEKALSIVHKMYGNGLDYARDKVTPTFTAMEGWVGEMLQDASLKLTATEKAELVQFQADITTGKLSSDFKDALDATVKAVLIAYLSTPLVFALAGSMFTAGQIKDIPALTEYGKIGIAYESIPGLGGISAWCRILLYTIPRYSYPKAQRERALFMKQHPEADVRQNIKNIIKTIADAGYPILGFFDGGWVIIPAHFLIKNKTGQKVLAWKIRQSLNNDHPERIDAAIQRWKDDAARLNGTPFVY